jgi:hypothetical protein
MRSSGSKRLIAVIALIGALTTTLTACPSTTPKARTVAGKRAPCSTKARGCEKKGERIVEVNCWQLQYVVTPGNKQEFECVSKEVWDHTKIGDKG